MSNVLSAEAERILHRSVSPLIILEGEDDISIKEQIQQGLAIENATRKLVSGDCSLWEYFELLETFEPDTDKWIEEIELNLEYEFVKRTL